MKQHLKSLIALVGALCVLGLLPTLAEDNTTNIISGTSVDNLAADYYVGNTGTNNYLQIDGAGQLSNVKDGYIGNAATANANSALVTGVNSLWGANNRIYLGNNGKFNSLTVADGASVVANAQVFIGSNAGSDSNWGLVTGPNSVLQASGVNAVVGRGGSYNSLTISNGGAFLTPGATGNSVIGALAGSSSNSVLVTGSGSVWNANGQLIVGNNTGTSFNSLTISNGGGAMAKKDILISQVAGGGNNAVVVTGAGSGLTNDTLTSVYVGVFGQSNSLTVADGARLETWSPFALGYGAAATNNSMLVTGLGSTWFSAGTVTVGYSGSGNSLTVADSAAATLLANFAIGTASSDNWTLITGANTVFDVAGWASVGQEFSVGANPTLTIANGGLIKAAQVIIPVGTARLILNGGALQPQADSAGFIVGTATPATTGKVLIQSGGATIDSNGKTIRLQLPLEEDAASSGGGLTKIGDGTLELSATNTYTGPTTVEAGTFGGNCALLTSSLLIKSGAAVAPGAQGLGTLAVAGGVTNEAGSTTIMEITSDSGGAEDSIISSNNIALNGTLVVTNLGTEPFSNGQEFVLYQSLVGITTNFSATTLPTLTGSLAWQWTLTPVSVPTTPVASLTLSVVYAGPSTPTNIAYSLSGTNLDLTWPGSYLGWYVQSNSVGLTSPGSWFDIPGSQTATSLTVTVDPAAPQVYYRMRYPQ